MFPQKLNMNNKQHSFKQNLILIKRRNKRHPKTLFKQVLEFKEP